MTEGSAGYGIQPGQGERLEMLGTVQVVLAGASTGPRSWYWRLTGPQSQALRPISTMTKMKRFTCSEDVFGSNAARTSGCPSPVVSPTFREA